MKKRYVPFIVAILLFACKEAYNPPVASPVTGYLVVDGFINSAAGQSRITLSRTTPLTDSINTVMYEQGAQVNIEGQNGATYPLYGQDSGNYVSDMLSLNPAVQYRIHIQTSDGKEYISDFSAVRQTPPIDSITWKIENGGVQLYVNAHDPADTSKYYQFRYSETWEFHSPFIAYLAYFRDPETNRIAGVYNYLDTSIYKCWKTQHPSAILLTSTEKLSDANVYFPIRYIAQNLDELSILYYIEVHQFALSKEAYLFKQKLKKNTEQLGTIFDAQPSELGGNIYCVSNAAEPVIGYVEVTAEQTAHLFIHNNELSNWPIHIPCTEVSVDNVPANYTESLLPTHVHEMMGQAIKSFYAADPVCVDCTLRGTNVRPSFWP